MYDYLLVVGPGRSGSDFLYQILKNHPTFVFPEIKEGIYYRSPKAFKRARQRLHGKERKLICDIANDAYHDPALPAGIEALRRRGFKILLVLLIRDHRDRAISMIRFRKSRGEPSALFGARHLERAAVRDRLIPEALSEIFRIDVDILTVYFPALTKNTAVILDVLTSLCQAPKFNWFPDGAVNESVSPRFIWLSTFGWACGVALRKLGLRRLLQTVKDNELVKNLFFIPLSNEGSQAQLSEDSLRTLGTSYRECQSIVENSSEKIGEGVFFRNAGAAA